MRDYTFKVANMRKEQDFTLYPYDGGDYIYLQSDKRFGRFNLRTGDGIINATNRNYANSIYLQMEPVKCQLPDDIKTAIQAKLWHNDGKDGNIAGVMFFENQPLFSK
jgi:hypothetical protein